MKKTSVVNIYNFIRKAHTDLGEFIPDDFETIRNQLILMKQYGLPGTYALKHDALTDPNYQALLKDYLDENDEISAWWEISSELCRRAGVGFRDSRQEEEYDDRVDSAYSLGYAPEDRKKLVDAYMADFYAVFGKYPKTIGSWVLDNVTISYAAEKYGIVGACICRDQLGTDGFTLWGGYPNGMYFPSKKNIFIPAQTEENQLKVPVFRLLGPDPIYNFEADARDGLQGVYSLEPAWLPGRDPKFISWIFSCITDEDSLGIGYAQVGQENNFLWENIRPGFEPQLKHVMELQKQGKVRIESMANSAEWFAKQYRITPPLSYQAKTDWIEGSDITAQNYASCNYRVSLLGEGNCLRIRELFQYREAYPSRYLNAPMKDTKSFFDALPVLFPQIWGGIKDRAFIRLADENGAEPTGTVIYDVVNDRTARARLERDGKTVVEIVMDPAGFTVKGAGLRFDRLPVFTGCDGNHISMTYEGFDYGFTVARGQILGVGCDGVQIDPAEGEVRLTFGEDQGEEAYDVEVPVPVMVASESRPVPPMTPEAVPADSVFPWGSVQTVTLFDQMEGIIRYTVDGSDPDENSPVYTQPIEICSDTVVKARLFTPAGVSEPMVATYRFSLKNMTLTSPTEFDWRPVFHGNGVEDLLLDLRGTTDYLDFRWRGSLQDIDVTATFEAPQAVKSVAMGFLSHHRSGLVYPEKVELYTGPDAEHLTLKKIVELPYGPCAREIVRGDVQIEVNETIGAFRMVARRYERMPQWCTYRGTTFVFTMADCLIVTPQED